MFFVNLCAHIGKIGNMQNKTFVLLVVYSLTNYKSAKDPNFLFLLILKFIA